MSATTALTIRSATAHDDADLRRVAALDSRPAIARPALVAEVDGEIVAALSLDGMRAIADPFRPTAELVELLKLRAAQLR